MEINGNGIVSTKMQAHEDPVSVRIPRINAEIVGSASKVNKTNLLSRESLLDVLQALYDECCLEDLQKYDQDIAEFVIKYKESIQAIKRLRVNITDFEIKNVIGRGNFGEVHLVKEKQTGDVYAMKTMRKFDNEFSRINFQEERDIMAFCISPWLTSLQYAFQDNSYLVYIMEYHPGGDLLGLLYRQGGTLPECDATFYLAEVILALEDLHSMGYTHRDIKPDNILLDRCGHIKLADFGSATKVDSKGLVSKGSPVGTPEYVAPEVLQCLDGQNNGYGVSCDFWSLGILAYELVIGNTPFTGANSTEIYSKIMNHQKSLEFPLDLIISQAYLSLIVSLVTDRKSRLNLKQIKDLSLFKNVSFDTLREQPPPYVPKISSVDDTSNFTDLGTKKKSPNVDTFKKRSRFSGRNLPFVGFTFTPDLKGMERSFDRKMFTKDEIVEGLTKEIETLRKSLVMTESSSKEIEILKLKLVEYNSKLEEVDRIRDGLERKLAIRESEKATIQRSLDLERADRLEFEKKTMTLIKCAKSNWEDVTRTEIESLTLEVSQQKETISELTEMNKMLNEQLKQALQADVKSNESVERLEALNRRSVVDLESRLQQCNHDSHQKIGRLKKTITDLAYENTTINNQIKEMKVIENNLKEKLRTYEMDSQEWNLKKQENQSRIESLVNQTDKFKEQTQEYKDEISKYQGQVDELHEVVKDVEKRNALLEMEATSMKEYKKENDELKNTVSKLQNDCRRIAQLEVQLTEEKDKNASLIKQLQESEKISTENQELREMRTKLWRVEKELSNAKIDRRILERELKDAQAEIKQLNEKVKCNQENAEENKKARDVAFFELNRINENLSMELVKVKENNRGLIETLKSEKEKFEEEKSILSEFKEIAKSKDTEINSLKSDVNSIKKECNNFENECKKLHQEKSNLMKLVDSTQREKRNLFEENDGLRGQIRDVNFNLNALREACTLLESQIIELEKINANLKQREISGKVNTDKLVQDVFEARRETQEAKKKLIAENDLKKRLENKVERLEEEMEDLQSKRDHYQQQSSEYKEYCNKLTNDLSMAEEKMGDLEVTSRTYKRKIDDLKSEVVTLKHESTGYLTLINQLREGNFKLKRQLSEEKEENDCLKERLRETDRELTEKNCYYTERELKSDATIQQQIKLIDYLQVKIDELTHKKKSLAEVLFGSAKKDSHAKCLPLNYKDLEGQLLKERHTNKMLTEELNRLKSSTSVQDNRNKTPKLQLTRHKSEVSKSSAPLHEILNNQPKQRSECTRQNSARMHHNIPHRFETKHSKTSLKCSACSETISPCRSMSSCSDCSINVHPECKTQVPNTCGLPEVFAKHYTEVVKKAENAEQSQTKDENMKVEGWIKVPGKSSWERRYALLSDTTVQLYSGVPGELYSKLVQTFELRLQNSYGKVVLGPPSSEIGMTVADSDVPFIVKVEVIQTCWPSNSLVFLTLSPQERDMWLFALNKILECDNPLNKLEKVLTIEENLKINEIVDLTEGIKLLGGETGLYSYTGQKLTRIDGIEQVHKMSVMSTTNQVLMIAEEDRRLITCDLDHIINVAQIPKSKLRFVEVKEDLYHFQFLQVSPFPKQQKICVATDHQLIIMSYEASEFVRVMILDTAEPTYCALFTEHSLIVGADKFYEVDLAMLQAEEFLDASDPKIKYAESCYKMRSFPLTLLQVCKNPKEYLLCFHEFAIFVDEYGQSSRQKEINFNHWPTALHYNEPHLYIMQFSGVEIWKMSEFTFNSEDDRTESLRLELDKFQYLGSNKHGIYLEINNEINFLDGHKLLPLPETSFSTETSEDRFTFSSSTLRSLDGNQSYRENGDDSKDKRVSFVK